MKKSIFICGTDTGVGKTAVAGLLARYLLDKGHKVVTQKWVQTGYVKDRTDLDAHLRFMGKTWVDFEPHRPSMAPYIFKFPASPHLSAREEGAAVDIKKIEKELERLSTYFDFIVIEGTGGLLVPLTQKTLAIDIVRRLNIPVLLVAANRLGSINHTLLSIEALNARKIKNLGVIFNDISNREDEAVLKDNPEIIKIFSDCAVLGRLRRSTSTKELRRQFAPIGDKIRIKQGWMTG